MTNSTSGRELHRYAIQGEFGSNSHMAAVEMLGNVQILPCALSAEVFGRLLSGEVDGAVLPIENSLHGSVAEHYDLMLRYPVRIAGESLLRIRHNVIVLPGVRFEELRVLRSHPVALSQCRNWFAQNLQVEARPFYDTAGAVKQMMAEGDRSIGAVAPELAATVYGAEVLLRGIEDNAENYTRFLRLHSGRAGLDQETPWDKISLAFTLQHRPGTLVAALQTLASGGANLTRIESRPVPGRPWEYVFFVDLRLGEPRDVHGLLAEMKRQCKTVEVLGIFAQATPLGD